MDASSTKAVTLSLTAKEEEELKNISKEFFGKENKSGMVRYWITQHNTKKSDDRTTK